MVVELHAEKFHREFRCELIAGQSDIDDTEETPGGGGVGTKREEEDRFRSRNFHSFETIKKLKRGVRKGEGERREVLVKMRQIKQPLSRVIK